MIHCKHCKTNTEVVINNSVGFRCCVRCGEVQEEVYFTTNVPGSSRTDCHQKTLSSSTTTHPVQTLHFRFDEDRTTSLTKKLNRARIEILYLVNRIGIQPSDKVTDATLRLFRIVSQRNFIRGRRINQVLAACSYIICRQENKAVMLRDFSHELHLSVFLLSAVYVDLCKLLRLEDHFAFQAYVDPCMYISRYVNQLNFVKEKEVAFTALQIIQNMNNEKIQTGRRPTGICGAALYVSSYINNHPRNRRKILQQIPVGDHTLRKRVAEFAAAEASLLVKRRVINNASRNDRMIDNKVWPILTSVQKKTTLRYIEKTSNKKLDLIKSSEDNFCINCSKIYENLKNKASVEKETLKNKKKSTREVCITPFKNHLQHGNNKSANSRSDTVSEKKKMSERPVGLLKESTFYASPFAAPLSDPLLKEDLSDLEDDQLTKLIHTDEDLELKHAEWKDLNYEYVKPEPFNTARTSIFYPKKPNYLLGLYLLLTDVMKFS